MAATRRARQEPLLSDQVSQREIAIILRELQPTLRLPGDVVEFGCYVGTTSVFLARELAASSPHQQLYVYDSFAGLPPKTAPDASPAGLQYTPGELAATKRPFMANMNRAGVPMPVITKAWFRDIQPGQLPARISFAFLDGDYYQSIMDSLRLVWPRLTPGARVVVDDYASEALPGAACAVDEWLRQHPARLQVEQSLAILRLPTA